MALKIKVWNGSERYSGYTTGVGKHVIHMVSGLAARPGVTLEMVVPRDYWARDRQSNPEGALASVSARRHPLDRRVAEALWLACAWPCIDDADTDWVYAPRERFVPARRARSVLTVHDVYAFEPSFERERTPAPRWARAQLTRALERADIVATVSAFTAERVQALFKTPASKFVVVGNGVEDHFFGPSVRAVSDFAPQLQGPYVLSVGGLTHKKGGAYVVELARALAAAAPEVTLAVTGPVEDRYKTEASALPNLRLLGRGYANEQMHALVASSALVVMLSEYEGFGIPAVEAMAAGVPVVAAQRASLPEIVGDAALLVDPAKSSSVRDATLAALNDTQMRADLVARGHTRAAAFRWSACVDRLLASMSSRQSASVIPLADSQAA